MSKAYIKYLEGAAKGSLVTVCASQFKNQFKDLKFDEKKKYFVKERKGSENYVKYKVIFLECK